jgi:hypothetical protein
MALQSARQYLGSLDSQPNSVIFDGRDGSLWNSSELAQLILTKLLKLSDDSD